MNIAIILSTIVHLYAPCHLLTYKIRLLLFTALGQHCWPGGSVSNNRVLLTVLPATSGSGHLPT
uniref:Uncharacterized protein n=1 Tax=Aeromonas hydrophila TaxID=644 RepID=Q6TF88_AERHY|nr:unknown [Aeromonas hydrophila]